MEYIIETPYEIGAKVWQAKYGQRHYEYTCPVCKGTGTLTNCDGESVRCGECYGHKTKGATAQDWHVEEKIIHDIEVLFGALGCCTVTKLQFDTFGATDGEGWDIEDETDDLDRVFFSEKDCREHCAYMNNKDRNRVY